jgi:hypothetical protein
MAPQTSLILKKEPMNKNEKLGKNNELKATLELAK